MTCAPNSQGVRTVKIQNKFKKIYAVFLTPYVNDVSMTGLHLIQYIMGTYSSMIISQQLSIYASSNQTVEATIVGII